MGLIGIWRNDDMEEECGNCGNECPELIMPGTNDPICLECARNHGIDERNCEVNA